MEKDHVEDKESDSVIISRRHANTHWLRWREMRNTEEAGGALFGGPRQFKLEQCVNDDDYDDDDYDDDDDDDDFILHPEKNKYIFRCTCFNYNYE